MKRFTLMALSLILISAATFYYVSIPRNTSDITAKGGGSYEAGAAVSISAGTPPAGKQFKKWTSSPEVTFSDKNSASTTFTMIAGAVTVTAVYKALQSSTSTYAVISPGNGSGAATTRTTTAEASTKTTTTTALATAPDSGYQYGERQDCWRRGGCT